MSYVCAECGNDAANTYVVTTLDLADPKGTRTEVCRDCDNKLRTAGIAEHIVAVREAAEGDSNDDELATLGDALDAALEALGLPGRWDDAYEPTEEAA